ncbi:MAG: efflux RND transporter periplasmic adaptor subunit [Cytophagaceae bacterium]|nr:efflux RND transporter periplasmic adaptor subunit [Gemmatimonadaceae bacterium]
MTSPTPYRSLLGAALLGASLAACGGENAAAKDADSAAPVTMTVGPENIALVVLEQVSSGPGISGTLAAEREATLRAEIGGAVLSTQVDQGSRVARGTVLARIDARTIEDQMLSARGGVTTATSSLNLAQRELERFTKLKEAGAIADREFESVKLNHDAAAAQLADAKARLTFAQKQVDDAQVRAPFNGIISARQVNAGDVVQPGGAMFTIIDPSSMRLEGSVPAAQLGVLRVGSPVTFKVSGYPDKAFTGRISRINPQADATTGQVRVVVSIPNERGGLVGGLFAEGRVAAEKKEGLTAPATAVDARGLRPAVLRLKGGRVERVDVEIGLRDEDSERVEIVQGVVAGDTLLIGAAQGISAGTLVKVSAPSDSKREASEAAAPVRKS